MPTYNDFTSMETQVINIGENLNNVSVTSNCVGLVPSLDMLVITGFQQPENKAGSIIWVRNRSTTLSIVLKHDSASSDIDNRIKSRLGVDFVLIPKQLAILMWDGAGWWIWIP
jgi:hypothetical protein